MLCLLGFLPAVYVIFGLVFKIMKILPGLTYCLSSQLHFNYPFFSCRKSFEWTVWFHFFAFIAIICLFWTNILPSFGMADGIDDLSAKLSSIWSCYFSSHCHTASKLGFLVPVFWLLFLYMSNLLVYRFQSNPVYVMCNACLAIPLLSVFYSLFLFDQMSGIQVKVSLSLGSLITMVTFPIAYAILSCYHSTSVVFNLLDTFDIY